MPTPAVTRLTLIIRRQPLAAIGLLLLATFVLAGLLAPWIAPANPAAIDLLHRLQPPSPGHWCGTDELGRDTLSRLLWGARPLAHRLPLRRQHLSSPGTKHWWPGWLPGWVA